MKPPEKENLSDLGKKLLGFITRKRLDIYSLFLKVFAKICFRIGNYYHWRSIKARRIGAKVEISKIIACQCVIKHVYDDMAAVRFINVELEEKDGQMTEQVPLIELSNAEIYKWEMKEAKFKFWFRSKFQHLYLWGKEDYRKMLSVTNAERRRIIRAYANPLCPDCYGKGEKGFNENTESYDVCRCVKQRIIKAKEQNNAKVTVNNIRNAISLRNFFHRIRDTCLKIIHRSSRKL